MIECIGYYPCEAGTNQNGHERVAIMTHPIDPRQILTATHITGCTGCWRWWTRMVVNIITITIVEPHTDANEPKECGYTKGIRKA